MPIANEFANEEWPSYIASPGPNDLALLESIVETPVEKPGPITD
jgi:hypothetical protein